MAREPVVFFAGALDNWEGWSDKDRKSKPPINGNEKNRPARPLGKDAGPQATVRGQSGQLGARLFSVTMPNGAHGGTFKTEAEAQKKADQINRDNSSRFAKDEASNMQGEAGRMARKQARDTMSGRYRP